MKILFIPSWYPNKNNPIWGNYFIKQAESMSKYTKIYMIHIDRIGFRNIKDFFDNKSPNHSFKFYQKKILNLKKINVDLSYNLYKKALYKLYKQFEKENGRPDIIFVQGALPAGLGAKYISEKEKIPFIVHQHSITMMQNYDKYFMDILNSADGYYAVSKEVQKFLMKKGRKDVKIIPNYIDAKKFDVKCKKYTKFTLINISNFFRIKALDVLMKALKIVIEEYNIKDIRLNIVGTGEYENYYKNVCSELNLNDYIKFKGFIKNEKLPTEICKSHVLCVSSEKETFGIPIIEAMAGGLPSISTKCGGPEEIINKNNGLLVPINNPKAFAKAIVEMYNNVDKYDSKKIKKYVYDNYDKDIVCKNAIKELKQVIKKVNK